MSQDLSNRKNKMASASQALDKITRPVFKKRGFAESLILQEWPSIIGTHLSRFTSPLKIVFSKDKTIGGVLHLTVSSGAIALEIQHLEKLILERINSFFGYHAVSKLFIKQGLLPQNFILKKEKKALTEEAKKDLEKEISPITDPDLKQALYALGESIK